MEESFPKPSQAQERPGEGELEDTRAVSPISVSATLGVLGPNPLMSPFG